MFLLQGTGSGWFCGHEPGGGGLSDTGIGEPLDSAQIVIHSHYILYIVHHTKDTFLAALSSSRSVGVGRSVGPSVIPSVMFVKSDL